MADDIRPAWERQKGEPKLWYDRFHEFCHAGPDRSLRGLYRQYRLRKAPEGATVPKSVNPPASWRKKAAEWLWRERADLFDANQREKRAAEWARRRDELREQEWTTHRKMMDRAQAMLGFPLTEQEVSRQESPDGRTTIVTTVQPVDWKLADVARIADIAFKLGRRAADMDQGRHDIVVSDWSDFTDDELRQIALGASPADVRRRREENLL